MLKEQSFLLMGGRFLTCFRGGADIERSSPVRLIKLYVCEFKMMPVFEILNFLRLRLIEIPIF